MSYNAMSSLLIARVILLREVNGTVFRRGRLRRVCDGSAVYLYIYITIFSRGSFFAPMTPGFTNENQAY